MRFLRPCSASESLHQVAHLWSTMYEKKKLCKKKRICKQKFVRGPKFELITQRPPGVGSNLHLTGGVGQRTPLPSGRKTGEEEECGL